MKFLSCSAVLAALVFTGCSDSSSDDSRAATEPQKEDNAPTTECTPSSEGWASVKTILESTCGSCHGETPSAGAPYSLMDMEALLAGPPGNRRVDNVIDTLRLDTMPPIGLPDVSASDKATLIDWATCGEGVDEALPDGSRPGGFDVTRDLYPSPMIAPQDAKTIEFRATNGTISVREKDRYQCFSFEWPAGDDRLIRRFEAIVDDARILHHMVLYAVDEGPGRGMETSCGAGLHSAVYAWAPGLSAFQFVEGGLITRGGQKYTLELHYNNREAYADVQDTSGVRLFHSETSDGPAIDMLTIGPEGFALPANERTAVQGECEVEEKTTVIATLPHMHEIGYQLQSTIVRKDGAEEDLVTITGWDFDYQLAYDTKAVVLEPGDVIRTQCVFNNPFDEGRRFGPYTNDEMCYNFLYVTPPPKARRCNRIIAAAAKYEPGPCAPRGSKDAVETVRSDYFEGSAPVLTKAGTLESGLWVLVDSKTFMSTAELGVATLDLDKSNSQMFGVLDLDTEGNISFDLQGTTYAYIDMGDLFERPVENSFGGTVIDAPNGELKISPTCPEEGEPFSFRYHVVDELLTIQFDFNVFVPGTIELMFKKTRDASGTP